MPIVGNKFIIVVPPKCSARFEYFLDRTYETVLWIYENGAEVFKTNADYDPAEGGYLVPKNNTSFDQEWSFLVASKCARRREIGFAESTPSIHADDGKNNYQIYCMSRNGSACPSVRDAVVNVFFRNGRIRRPEP